MSTATQDYFSTLAQQTQEASRAASEAWTRTIQSASGRIPSVANVAATREVIDQMSDFAITLINVQRTLAKQFTDSVATVTEKMIGQAGEIAQGQSAPE